MKILLDAGLPYTTCNLLRSQGHDVLHANDIRIGAPDHLILATAREQGRVIFTLDADFHAMLALEGAAAPSVVRLRIQSLRHEEAALIIQGIVTRFTNELQQGAVVSATRQQARIRRLPLS